MKRLELTEEELNLINGLLLDKADEVSSKIDSLLKDECSTKNKMMVESGQKIVKDLLAIVEKIHKKY